MYVGVAGRNRVAQKRIGVHGMVVLMNAEVKMTGSVDGVAGVADEAEKIAALHFHPFVEARCPPIQVRVVEGSAILGREPEAVTPLRLISDVTDNPVGDRDELGSPRGEDIDSLVASRSAIPGSTPAILQVVRGQTDHRHPKRRQGSEESFSAFGKLLITRFGGRHLGGQGRNFSRIARLVSIQVDSELCDELAEVVVIGRELRFGGRRRSGHSSSGQRRGAAEQRKNEQRKRRTPPHPNTQVVSH